MLSQMLGSNVFLKASLWSRITCDTRYICTVVDHWKCQKGHSEQKSVLYDESVRVISPVCLMQRSRNGRIYWQWVQFQIVLFSLLHLVVIVIQKRAVCRQDTTAVWFRYCVEGRLRLRRDPKCKGLWLAVQWIESEFIDKLHVELFSYCECVFLKMMALFPPCFWPDLPYL